MKTVKVSTELETNVLTISELYKLIPELKKFEGVQFKDFKSLLSQFIPALEKADWEFVQCVQGNPILFIVRKRTSTVVLAESEPTIVYKTTESVFSPKEEVVSKEEQKNSLQESIPVIKIPEIRKVETPKLFSDKVLF